MIKLFFCLLFSAGSVFALDSEPYNPDNIAREFLWEEFGRLELSKRPKVGVALSGGGARGFAHVGVLEVLVNAGFPVDYVSGTSMGAVVGAFFAAGISMQRLWDISKNASFSYASKDFGKIGLLKLIFKEKMFSSSEMENFVEKNIGSITFSELRIPFSCSAMDIKTGEKIIFRQGPLALAVRASMNMPGLFKPVRYRHRYLVDGGVVDFLPVDSARNMGADWVLASITLGDFSESALKNVLTYLLRVMDVRGALLADASVKKADFVVDPKVGHIGFAEFEKSFNAGELGIERAYGKIEKAKESLILFSLKNIIYEKE